MVKGMVTLSTNKWKSTFSKKKKKMEIIIMIVNTCLNINDILKCEPFI